MACEQCGAVGWGNLMCLVCLRWNKRAQSAHGWPGETTRLFIHMAKRRVGAWST